MENNDLKDEKKLEIGHQKSKATKILWIILGILFIALIISGKYYASKKNQINNLEHPKVLTRDIVLNYLSELAKSERVELSDCLIINTKDKIRGIVGAAEFEFNNDKKILIIRGLIYKRINEAEPIFRESLLKKLYQTSLNNPEYFDIYSFEDDLTSGELNKEFPERLNLRYNLKHANLTNREFVNFVDELNIYTYRFNHDIFDTVFESVYQDLV